MHICTVIKDTVQSLETERNNYVFKRDLNDDSDGTHLTSFGIVFQLQQPNLASITWLTHLVSLFLEYYSK